MKKKLFKITAIVLLMASLMYAEYRVIMHTACPYVGNGTEEGNVVYIEVFGRVDEYYAEKVK